MRLSWSDRESIARALIETYPTADRLKITLPELQEMVTLLPEFAGPPEPPKTAHLESILWTWMRLADPVEDAVDGRVDGIADGHAERGTG